MALHYTKELTGGECTFRSSSSLVEHPLCYKLSDFGLAPITYEVPWARAVCFWLLSPSPVLMLTLRKPSQVRQATGSAAGREGWVKFMPCRTKEA